VAGLGNPATERRKRGLKKGKMENEKIRKEKYLQHKYIKYFHFRKCKHSKSEKIFFDLKKLFKFVTRAVDFSKEFNAKTPDRKVWGFVISLHFREQLHIAITLLNII